MQILLLSAIDPATQKSLRKRYDLINMTQVPGDEWHKALAQAEVVIFRSGVKLDAASLAKAPHLKCIIRAGAGLDNIDLTAAKSRHIDVYNLPEPGGKAVAEMGFGLMLALARHIVPAHMSWSAGRWTKQDFLGRSLAGKTLGIVGLGRIGTQLAHKAQLWGMDVVGCISRPLHEVGEHIQGVPVKTLDEVISSADFLSLNVPLTPKTQHLINEKRLNQMKEGSFLVNLSRGGVLDENAVAQVLDNGSPLHGVALDVHKHEGDGQLSPLAGRPNVILTPHIGAMTLEAQAEIGQEILSIVEKYQKEKHG